MPGKLTRMYLVLLRKPAPFKFRVKYAGMWARGYLLFFAQVGTFHIFVVQKFTRWSFGSDLSRIQNVAVVWYLKSYLRVLLHKQNSYPLPAQFTKGFKNLADKRSTSPKESSPRRSKLGFDMSARPMANICCSPPLKVPAFWSDRSCKIWKSW